MALSLERGRELRAAIGSIGKRAFKLRVKAKPALASWLIEPGQIYPLTPKEWACYEAIARRLLVMPGIETKRKSV